MSLTYTLAQLQEALQEKSEDRARSRLRLLEEKHGFPRALPGFTLRWSKPAVDHWFDQWGAPVVKIRADAGNVTDIRDLLEKQYGAR